MNTKQQKIDTLVDNHIIKIRKSMLLHDFESLRQILEFGFMGYSNYTDDELNEALLLKDDE
jgi:hypothetical protein